METTNCEITLKNVQTMQGRDGIALNCDVWVNGVKAFNYLDEGNGGG